jgi:hypothetical protein
MPPKPPPLPTPPAWEYKIPSFDLKFEASVEQSINMLGTQGWELVGVAPTPGGTMARFLFKRKKRA